MLKLKRVYDPPAGSDGKRVLVDRLWPRGLSKEKAGIDLWLKECAPSQGLRKWFGHALPKWPLFKKRYWEELDKNERAVGELRGLEKREGTVTLVFGAKDVRHNNAVALFEFLKRKM